MKRKSLDRRSWHRVSRSRQILSEWRGGLVLDYRAEEVLRPLRVPFGDHERLILDHGSRWVSFLPHGAPYALTNQIAPNGQSAQLYVDICGGWSLDPAGWPVIDDLYLDVIALYEVLNPASPEAPGGWRVTEQHLIDVDELEEAERGGALTPEQVRLAWASAREVQAGLESGTLTALGNLLAYLRAFPWIPERVGKQ